jgi:mRNA interferase MazF
MRLAAYPRAATRRSQRCSIATALIAPCTTTVRGLASEVILEPDHDPIPRRSAINLDSIESVSIGILVERLGRLSDERMHEVCAALDVAVDCRG